MLFVVYIAITDCNTVSKYRNHPGICLLNWPLLWDNYEHYSDCVPLNYNYNVSVRAEPLWPQESENRANRSVPGCCSHWDVCDIFAYIRERLTAPLREKKTLDIHQTWPLAFCLSNWGLNDVSTNVSRGRRRVFVARRVLMTPQWWGTAVIHLKASDTETSSSLLSHSEILFPSWCKALKDIKTTSGCFFIASGKVLVFHLHKNWYQRQITSQCKVLYFVLNSKNDCSVLWGWIICDINTSIQENYIQAVVLCFKSRLFA